MWKAIKGYSFRCCSMFKYDNIGQICAWNISEQTEKPRPGQDTPPMLIRFRFKRLFWMLFICALHSSAHLAYSKKRPKNKETRSSGSSFNILLKIVFAKEQPGQKDELWESVCWIWGKSTEQYKQLGRWSEPVWFSEDLPNKTRNVNSARSAPVFILWKFYTKRLSFQVSNFLWKFKY